jgi:hypothetical protein
MTIEQSQPPQYEYYDSPEARAMIAECGFRLASYIQQEDIGSVVLVDRAARNLYIPIGEAYSQLGGDVYKAPRFYFLNPAGFMSPQQHDMTDYTTRAVQAESEKAGISEHAMIKRVHRSNRLYGKVMRKAEDSFVDDVKDGGQYHVAKKLTTAFDEAIKKDGRFNSRVLVVDACMHSGGSLRGITTALKDIGVIDVRTAVVNAQRNRTTYQPDFLVFGNQEIVDRCKPFGPQEGIQKGDGASLISTLAKDGLSQQARQARKELHMIMKQAPELRQNFAQSQSQDHWQLPRAMSLLMDAIFSQEDDPATWA